MFGLLWDAGEFSWLARSWGYMETLKDEGFECVTKEHSFNDSGHLYKFRECKCENDGRFSKYAVGLPRTKTFQPFFKFFKFFSEM
jgi:hypothetical protein